MAKILITGSAGLVGGEAVAFFRNQGWEVTGIDNNMRAKLFATNPQEVEIECDIRDYKTVDALFTDADFDAIIHTAAQPSHDWSKDHPIDDFVINTIGTLNLLEATRRHCPNAVFVNMSTDKVYGENMKRSNLEETDTRYDHPVPYDETLSVDQSVHSPFGVSKIAADLYVQEYSYQYGIKAVNFRAGCITGRRHQGAELHGFLAYLAKCIKTGTKYRIFGYKGKQVRDQIHAYDLVCAMYHFILNPKIAAVYNIGGGPERSVSILEAIKLIEKQVKKKAVLEFVDEPRFGDRQWDVIDSSKFKKDYPNWAYTYSLQDIIKDLCTE